MSVSATLEGSQSRSTKRASRRGPAAGNHTRAQALTAVALDLFAERNYATVTIKDIGHALGVNTALIYYYFENKEDLFRAAIESAVNRAFDHFRELRLKHDNPADIINDWLDNHVDLHEPIQKLVKVSLDYAGLPIRLPRVDRAIRQFYDEERRMLSQCIQDGIDQGVFRAADPDRCAEYISTYLDGLMVRSKIFPTLDMGQAVQALRENLWTILGYRESAGANGEAD